MTATEELRRMLDERGVEWDDIDTGSRRSLITLWHGTDGMEWQFYENTKTNWTLLKSRRDYLTPEQAIAATLGRWDYHDEGDPSDFCCSECGVRMFTNTSDTYTMIASDGRTIIEHPNYCPNCGRKVVG